MENIQAVFVLCFSFIANCFSPCAGKSKRVQLIRIDELGNCIPVNAPSTEGLDRRAIKMIFK